MNNRPVTGRGAAICTRTTPDSTENVKAAGGSVTGKNDDNGNQSGYADERVDNPADRGSWAVHQSRQRIDL